MTEKALRQIILKTVLPRGSILEEGENFFSTTIYNVNEYEISQIEILRECGVRFSISAWPRGVYKPNLDDLTMKGRLVMRFEWAPLNDSSCQSIESNAREKQKWV